MFDKLDYVFYASGGVCQIDDVTPSPFEDVGSGSDYYVLHSVEGGNGKMYVPVLIADNLMRGIMTRSELDDLLRRIKDIPIIDEPNTKQLRLKYSDAVKTNCPDEWVKVLKTFYNRERNSALQNHRLSDTERSYAAVAKKHLYTEMSLVLGMDEREIEDYISDYILNN